MVLSFVRWSVCRYRRVSRGEIHRCDSNSCLRETVSGARIRKLVRLCSDLSRNLWTPARGAPWLYLGMRTAREPQPALGQALRRLRQRAGVSQEELGHCAGVHPTWVSKIESGR